MGENKINFFGKKKKTFKLGRIVPLSRWRGGGVFLSRGNAVDKGS